MVEDIHGNMYGSLPNIDSDAFFGPYFNFSLDVVLPNFNRTWEECARNGAAQHEIIFDFENGEIDFDGIILSFDKSIIKKIYFIGAQY